jgi:hypothetical protein
MGGLCRSSGNCNAPLLVSFCLSICRIGRDKIHDAFG